MMKNKIYIVVKIIILFCSMCGYPLVHLHCQNLIIDSTTFDTGQYLYFSPDIITSPDTPTKPVQVTGNAYVDYKAVQYVHLGCGFSTSISSGGGIFHASVGSQPQECPTAIITEANESCGVSILSAATSTNILGTITSYQWLLNGDKIQGAINVTYTTSLSGEYSVLISNSNNCTAISNTLSVTVHPLPLPAIAGLSEACIGSVANYTSELGMTNYSWSTSKGGTITEGAGTNSIMVIWNVSGAQWVEANYTDANGCEANSPTNFVVNVNASLPTPTLSGPTPVCQNSSGNIYTTDAGMTEYTWLVTAGGIITSGGTNLDSTVAVTWLYAGPQTVSVNYKNIGGCIASAPKIKDVLVRIAPTPVLFGDENVKENQVVTYSTPYNSGNSYSWNASHGNPEICFPNHNCLTLTWNFPCAIINPGYVKVAVTNLTNGCSTTVTKWITIVP